MNVYDKIFNLDTNFGIWRYTDRLRITYVSPCWLVVWDHQQKPPARYDCQASDHPETCVLAEKKLRELQTA